MPTHRKQRALLFLSTLVMALVVACGPGGTCESDADRDFREAQERRQFELLQRGLQQSATATSTATAAATTAAPAASASATATAAAFGGKIALGFDHPPFAPGNGSVGGNSVGIVCGAITGAPGGSIITINLTGGTGAPASVNGPLGADGGFMLPFPIMSFGPMNAAVGGVKTAAGAALTGSVPPVMLQVGAGADVACSAR